jgi:mRNA-degrading endonuclease RelE of RelBE toxin-antitoxin system
MKLTFVEMAWFTRRLRSMLGDADYGRFQRELLNNPAAGDVMPGCGGPRKARAGDSSRGKGKRGGLRIVYLYIPEAYRIDLVDIYGKGEKTGLSSQEKRDLAALVRQWKQEAVAAYKRQRGLR